MKCSQCLISVWQAWFWLRVPLDSLVPAKDALPGPGFSQLPNKWSETCDLHFLSPVPPLGSPAFLSYPINPLLPAAPVWVWHVVCLRVKSSRPISLRVFLDIFLEQNHWSWIPWPHSSPMSGMTHVYGTRCLYNLLNPWQTLLMDPPCFPRSWARVSVTLPTSCLYISLAFICSISWT